MSDIEITKIVVLRGLGADLPETLDPGELAFATDQGRLFVGHEPTVGQPQFQRTTYPYQNIEILTENSIDTFAKMHGDRMREGGGPDYYSANLSANTGWENVKLDRDGTLIDYRIPDIYTVSAIIDYAATALNGETIRSGTMTLHHFEEDNVAPRLVDHGVAARDMSLTGPANLDARQVYGRVYLRFAVAGPITARYLVLQYRNFTVNPINLRFKVSRPDYIPGQNLSYESFCLDLGNGEFLDTDDSGGLLEWCDPDSDYSPHYSAVADEEILDLGGGDLFLYD